MNEFNTDDFFRLKKRLKGKTTSRQSGIIPDFETLGLKHAIEFHRLYQEPDIASFARLPELSTLKKTVEWIKKQTNKPDRLLTAIMHPEYGFAGVICLKLRKDGLVWYWLGKKYRGQGLAASALLRLREAVESRSMLKNLYATVYKNNHASRKTLKKAGFKQIFLSFKPPHEKLLLYGVIKEDKDHIARVNALPEESAKRRDS